MRSVSSVVCREERVRELARGEVGGGGDGCGCGRCGADDEEWLVQECGGERELDGKVGFCGVEGKASFLRPGSNAERLERREMGGGGDRPPFSGAGLLTLFGVGVGGRPGDVLSAERESETRRKRTSSS